MSLIKLADFMVVLVMLLFTVVSQTDINLCFNKQSVVALSGLGRNICLNYK